MDYQLFKVFTEKDFPMTETDTNYTKSNNQFIKQAVWTKSAKNRIYRKIGLKGTKRTLEVGCGTGIITKKIRKKETEREQPLIKINYKNHIEYRNSYINKRKKEK